MGLFGDLQDFIGPAALGAGYLMGGPAGGALMAGGLGYMGAQTTNQQNAANVDAANQFSAQQYATRYQQTVKDLEAAGLNPMLAYSQGAGSPPTAQAVQFQNPAVAGVSAYQQYRGVEGGATKDYATAAQAEASIKQIDATVDKIKAETANVPIEGDRLRSVIVNLAESSAKMAQEGETQTVIRKHLGAMISKLRQETNLLDLDVQAAKQFDNIGRESQQFKPIVDMLKAIIRK